LTVMPPPMVGIFVLHLSSDGVPINRWLVSFDPDAFQGRGHIDLTDDASKAQRFADASSALATWKQPSTVVPFRIDGKPNRPLSAYTVEVRPLPDY